MKVVDLVSQMPVLHGCFIVLLARKALLFFPYVLLFFLFHLKMLFSTHWLRMTMPWMMTNMKKN